MKAWGITLPHLFFQVTCGMLHLIGAAEKRKAESCYSISITADTAEELLLGWLRDVLFTIYQNKLLVERFQFETIEVNESSSSHCYLKGFLFTYGGPCMRHDFCTEIKAITRHMFQVKKERFVWRANLIFDV